MGVLVSQLLARRNYDVAKILNDANVLDALVTDMYFKENQISSVLLSKLLPSTLSGIYKTYRNDSIPDFKVHSSQINGLLFKAKYAINSKKKFRAYVPAFKRLNNASIRKLKELKSSHVYAFDTAALELFKAADDLKCNLVLEQCIASRQHQIEMYNLFEQEYGLSFESEIKNARILKKREEAEWELASTIICPSEYVSESLRYFVKDSGKLKKVPYFFESKFSLDYITNWTNQKFAMPNKAKTILFVGNSDFRKGVQDLILAAKKLENHPVNFRLIGSINSKILRVLQIEKPENIEFVGRVSKAVLFEEYLNADLFFLPSYLEGSAMVGLEALSFGLPAITTHQSGTIITNKEGFIGNAGDLEFFVDSINRLLADDELRHFMSINSARKARRYNSSKYRDEILNAIGVEN